MISIGICDDQREAVLSLKNTVEIILHKLDVEYHIFLFYSGEEIVKSKDKFDLIFLDIEMNGIDGIETGDYIRRHQPDCKVVMATGRVDRFKEAFHIQAFRFVTKPFDYKEIEETIDAVVELMKLDGVIELFYQRISYKIQYSQIYYIQAYNGYSEFCVERRIFRKDISLSEVERILTPPMFARINRNYIVNMKYIEFYKDDKIAVNNKILPVSRRRKKLFEQIYVTFDMTYRG